ncbi:MAG: ParB/RepB/Spo0J family partition protein [Candidatus Promineifilaceae bacterium]
MSKKRALGRGLGSLIPGGELDDGPAGGLTLASVDAIRPNPRQPRAALDDDLLAELAESIREHGLIQPLVVRQGEDGAYTLIAGERRWRAAQLAGLDEVPVVVKEASPQAMLELALIENIQRADLNPLEEAAAYRQLVEEFGLTQDEVARRVGRSRPAVANTLRLLNAPAEVQAAVTTGTISAAHARTLLALPDPAVQSALLGPLLSQELSVRQLEVLVRALLRLPAAEAQLAVVQSMSRQAWNVAQAVRVIDKLAQGRPPPPRPTPRQPAELADLEAQFQHSLGTRVNIRQGRRGGQVVIHFYSDEELQAIYEAIVGASGSTGRI